MNSLLISELAERAGVNVSTVRFYERIGLVPDPSRSPSGYRLYEPAAQSRLVFITRARRLGLSLEQIGELLAVWDGTNCVTTRGHLVELLDQNMAELRTRIAEMEAFAEQLVEIRARLADPSGPDQCSPELDCCAPALAGPLPVILTRANR